MPKPSLFVICNQLQDLDNRCFYIRGNVCPIRVGVLLEHQ